MHIRAAAFALILAAADASAQPLDATMQGEPYFRYSVSIPDALTQNGSTLPLELDLFIARSGDVEIARTPSAAGLCDPICWLEGNPPQRVCLIFQGCPGAPGTGGPGTLQTPILVQLSAPPAATMATGGQGGQFTLSVRPISQERVNAPLEYRLNIPPQ
jgi:hypothetical protein